MTAPDARQLKDEQLAKGAFPAPSYADFRLYLMTDVHRGIQEHAKADVSVEICGVLVGRWERDDGGPYAVVTNHIRCDNATSKFAEVTFTHESWAQINKEMDTRFSDLRILGWYHSHPDFGIFLSDRDVFIHENFFSGAGQVAYVVDPVRDLEGVFFWKEGKPEPIDHYWVGNRVRTVESSRRSPGSAAQPAAEVAHSTLVRRPAEEPDSLGLATKLLAWVAVFLLGYLLAGTRSRWEREMIAEGAVAHYGLNKVMKFGLEQRLNEIGRLVAGIRQEARKLPAPGKQLSKEQAAEAARRQKTISDNLLLCERALEQLGAEYGLSEKEQRVLSRLIAEKQAALRSPAPSQAEQSAPQKPAESGSQKRSNSADLEKERREEGGTPQKKSAQATPPQGSEEAPAL